MLKDIDYSNRIIESHLFVDRMTKFALTTRSQLAMAQELTQSFMSFSSKMFADKKFFIDGNAPSAKEIDDISKKIEKEVYFSNLNKAANYLNWVHNYSLILMCSIFEAFLVDAFREVVFGTENPVVNIITENFLNRFEEDTIVSKVEKYNRVLGITHNDFFDFSLFTDEIQKKFSNFNQKQLQDLYMKRNQAAHTDKAVVSKIELEFASDAFQKLMLNLVSKLHKKYALSSQMILMAQGKNPLETKKAEEK